MSLRGIWVKVCNASVSSNLKIQNTGCSNFQLSAVDDHEKCKSHIAAVDILAAKSVAVDEVKQSTAGKALRKLKEADRVSVLYRNAQAVIKNNKSLRDYGGVRLLKHIDSGPINVYFFEIFITPEAIRTLYFRPR
jgi:hypothetical protein